MHAEAAGRDGKNDGEAPATIGAWLALLPDHLKYELHLDPASDELVVTFAAGKNYFMTQVQFRRNTLFLADIKGSYYVFKAAFVAKVLRGIAASFSKVIFIGASKGAYGALLLSGLCAQGDTKRPYFCLAFSPQTQIYPENPNLSDLPSYQGFLGKAATSTGWRLSAERFGVLDFITRLKNIQITIFYSELHARDRAEADRLFAPHIRKYPVPFMLHNSVLPFRMRGQSRAEIHKYFEMVEQKRHHDADLARTMPADFNDLVEMIVGNRWTPDLETLIDEMTVIR